MTKPDVFFTNFFTDQEPRSAQDVQRRTLKTYVRPIDGTTWAVIGELDGKLLILEVHHHMVRVIAEGEAVRCDHRNADPARTVCDWTQHLSVPFTVGSGAIIYWQEEATPIGVSLTDGEIAEIRAAQGLNSDYVR